MFSIFSTQNLQTFLRRKNLRPPSRGGPPGPERLRNRGPERGPSWRGPSDRGRSLGADASTAGAGAFVSSVILAPSFLAGVPLSGPAASRMEYFRHTLPGAPLRPWQEFHSPRAHPLRLALGSLSFAAHRAACSFPNAVSPPSSSLCGT